MKTILIYTLLAVLTLGLSCKSKPANEPVPDLSKCRIIKETYKTLIGKLGGAETARVGDKTYNVQTDRVTTFTYDEQGRLTTETYVGSRGTAGSITYRYEPNHIIRTNQYKVEPPLVSGTEQDTVLLNEQGFISRKVNTKYRYDARGFKVQDYIDTEVLWRHTVQNGNVTQSVFTIGIGAINQMTYDMTHDLSKRNLPNRYPFLGQADNNLLVKRLFTLNKTSGYYQPGPAYEIKFYYTFDTQGRIKRRIASGKSLNPTWQQEADPSGLGVIDYEYDCN